MPPDTANAGARSGADQHHRALERLYGSAPINDKFQSTLEIPGEGLARLRFTVSEDVFHAAGAAHGTIYFKMLDDAAFYAANTLSTDFFLLTTSFNMNFTMVVWWRRGDGAFGSAGSTLATATGLGDRGAVRAFEP
ncbi:MAG: hypothetical protein AAFY19_03060, partial [Pseudomonadota bacterium]